MDVIKATRLLTALTPNCNHMAMGLPPVTYAVLLIAVILVKCERLGGVSERTPRGSSGKDNMVFIEKYLYLLTSLK
jgi:hypothetical protein